MRQQLWSWARASWPAHSLLPWWLVAIRVVLFPLDTLYWYLSRSRGYQIESDAWLIDGVRWSSGAIARLPQQVGRVFLVVRDGDTLIFVWMAEFDTLALARLVADEQECREILKEWKAKEQP